MHFCHLHCHTDRSLLDGVGRSAEYAAIAAKHGQTHLAITDHGQLYGLPAHKKACEANGIKPIYGCELYVNDNRHTKQTTKGDAKKEALKEGTLDPTFTDAHLVVLAADQTGWQNLLRLNHDSVLNGYYYKPRTTHELVCQHAEGLYATTACMGSQFGQYALMGDVPRLKKLLAQFKDAFGDRFFWEMHVNEIPEQAKVNAVLQRVCKDMGIPPILTCDVHYACAQDAARQDEMISVSRHTALDDPKVFKVSARNLWFHTPEQARELAIKFGLGIDKKLWTEAVANTHRVACGCNANIYDDGTLRPPRYIAPDGQPVSDPFTTLRTYAAEGFREHFSPRIKHDKDRAKLYVDRLNHELSVIKKCHMSDFYLVTMDVVRECRRRGIFVWTRGSGCASLVAACIGITTIDPVRFGLLFERFVDPSRPNAPDFDLDIDADRRHEVIEWMVKKYGGANGERVARISSLSTFGIKGAIRDVCFVHSVPDSVRFGASDACDRLPPGVEDSLAEVTVDEREETIDNAITAMSKLDDDRLNKLVSDYNPQLRAALTMVGRARNRTKHAAGYVVAPDALVNHIPIDSVGSGDEKETVTAWGEGLAAQDIGGTGLMKIDLLGLEVCAVLSNCMSKIAERRGVPLADIEREFDTLGPTIDGVLSDPAVMVRYHSGRGFGLHQFGDAGQVLAGYAKKMKLTNVDQITAIVALYRPGSMKFIDDYIMRAHGKARIPVVHPIYDEETAETYGIIVYQEQVMKILMRLGGFAPRDSYAVVKMISKQQASKIKQARAQFEEYAVNTVGLTQETATSIFDVIQDFGGYGFNKGHAASYAVLSYLTAMLQAKYPVEFWWAWLNKVDNSVVKTKGGDVRKAEMYMRAATQNSIELLPPMVGYSADRWRITKTNKLHAPLSLVRGIGEAAALIQHDAYKKQRWSTVWEWLAWAESNRRAFTSKCVLACAECGAISRTFPDVPLSHAIGLAKAWSDCKATRAATAVEQLRSRYEADPESFAQGTGSDAAAIQLERNSIGFAFWSNPWKLNNREQKVLALVEGKRIVLDTDRRSPNRRRPMLLKHIKKHNDSKGHQMAFLKFEGLSGDPIDGVCFSSTWNKIAKLIRTDRVYLVAGEFDRSRSNSYIVSAHSAARPAMKDIDCVELSAIPST